MVVLEGVNPTIFNFVSDLVGKAAVVGVGFAFSYVYLLLMSWQVKSGKPIPINVLGVVPRDFLAATQLARVLKWSMPALLAALLFLMTDFAHSIADLGLEFVTVEREGPYDTALNLGVINPSRLIHTSGDPLNSFTWPSPKSADEGDFAFASVQHRLISNFLDAVDLIARGGSPFVVKDKSGNITNFAIWGGFNETKFFVNPGNRPLIQIDLEIPLECTSSEMVPIDLLIPAVLPDQEKDVETTALVPNCTFSSRRSSGIYGDSRHTASVLEVATPVYYDEVFLTRKSTGSSSDGRRVQESDACSYELDAANGCVNSFPECATCVNNAYDAIFEGGETVTCSDFEVGICSAIYDDCDCGTCTDELEAFYECLALEGGCSSFNCDSDRPEPMIKFKDFEATPEMKKLALYREDWRTGRLVQDIDGLRIGTLDISLGAMVLATGPEDTPTINDYDVYAETGLVWDRHSIYALVGEIIGQCPPRPSGILSTDNSCFAIITLRCQTFPEDYENPALNALLYENGVIDSLHSNSNCTLSGAPGTFIVWGEGFKQPDADMIAVIAGMYGRVRPSVWNGNALINFVQNAIFAALFAISSLETRPSTVEEVSPSINAVYIIFMLLPFVILVGMVIAAAANRRSRLPIPHNPWELMVVGSEENVDKRSNKTEMFPEPDRRLVYALSWGEELGIMNLSETNSPPSILTHGSQARKPQPRL
jgi:hypothetical protein